MIGMAMELKVHPSFFREFATKTWISPNEIVKELVENAFDEDATKVLLTILTNGSIIIEDDAGMNKFSMEKFLLLGSPHKKYDHISPKFKRVRTGRYGTGRLSFLTSFEKMKIRTKNGDFIKSIVIDADTLDKLYSGNVVLPEESGSPLRRNGTELYLSNPKLAIDSNKLIKEIRKLAILRHPMFEVFFKLSEKFEEWNFQDAQVIRPPEIQGHRIPVNLDSGRITGEIVIARRPLSDDERGIAIMIGSHIVTRSNFGFEAKLNRVSGYIRCDSLTSRFADKSALIEDAEYSKFMDIMKSFVDMTVLPSLSQYEDVLITREESRIYKEIDKVLGQALIESSETQEEVEELSTIDVTEVVKSEKSKDHLGNSNENAVIDSEIAMPVNESHGKFDQSSADLVHSNIAIPADRSIIRDEPETRITQSQSATGLANVTGGVNNDRLYDIQNSDRQMNSRSDDTSLKVRKIRTPVVKRTFALKKVGYKVIPYEDGSDSRYSFTSENVVFVNKANSTYKAEANRGDEFLLRHIINLVAEAVAQTKHPEGKDALELQNRLIAEAIRIHDGSINRK
jgi:Histidine kinase-, DNA gyrase B-, and HSP90-like ATPase